MRDTRQQTEIVFVPTWRCNLNCSYCDYVAKADIQSGKVMHTELECFDNHWKFERELLWPEWIILLNRFRPYHLELTGGEPTMKKDLADLLAHLPCDSTWAITSNSLNDIRLYQPENCKFWTASYHFHSLDKFMGNMEFLKLRGFPFRVTLVMTPDNFDELMDTIEIFKSKEIMVNVHPMLKQGFSWKEHEALIGRMRLMSDGVWINFVEDVPKEWAPKHHSHCTAGGNYFSLMPDGTVLRCYSGILWDSSLGHLADFNPDSSSRECGHECVFHCDMRGIQKTSKGGS